MAGIKYAKFGDYMTKTKGGKDSSASSSYGSNPGGGGGAGYSAPSAAPSDNEIKNTKSIKTKLKDSLQNIVDNKGGQGYETAPGIVAIPTMGKNTGKFKKIEDKLKAGIPLSGGEQVIADFYLSSAVNPYAAKMQQFKEQPGGIAAFKEKFPNPLAVMGGAIGDFFKKGTLLGKFLTSLNKSDQNKVDIITNDPQGVKEGPPAYDVNQYGLGNMGPDKIIRDLMRQSQQNTIAPYGIPNPGAEASDAGIMTVNQENEARKRQMVADYFKVDVSGMSQSTIDSAFESIMNKMTPNEDNMMGTGSNINYSPDYSNFQEEIVDEVVEGPEQPLDGSNIFEIGSGNLAGSVSETDYTAPNIEGTNPRGQVSSARSTPLIGGDPNVPYGYEENMLDVLAEDNMATGGYMSSFPNQNLNTQSLSASDNIDDRIMKNLQFEKMSPGMMGYNTGGYAGMSTFDKLKMIADSGYQS
jgi:hypothetical protein